jgi:hypothetical protein
MKTIKNRNQATLTQTSSQSTLISNSEYIDLNDAFDEILIQLLKINNNISPDINLFDLLDK